MVFVCTWLSGRNPLREPGKYKNSHHQLERQVATSNVWGWASSQEIRKEFRVAWTIFDSMSILNFNVSYERNPYEITCYLRICAHETKSCFPSRWKSLERFVCSSKFTDEKLNLSDRGRWPWSICLYVTARDAYIHHRIAYPCSALLTSLFALGSV